MKKTLKGFIIGFLTAAITISCVSYAATRVRIVIDNKELIPTDVNGKRVDPIIIDGTTYLPVRAVANAVGKAVYWDGPSYTVYIGDKNGELEYPTVELQDMTSINDIPCSTDRLIDNYGNNYTSAIYNWYSGCELEYLTKMQYSKFKGILYVPDGESGSKSCSLKIIADEKTIYTSPLMNKSSEPVKIDVNITGYNNIKIQFSDSIDEFDSIWGGGFCLCLGDAGFYQ